MATSAAPTSLASAPSSTAPYPAGDDKRHPPEADETERGDTSSASARESATLREREDELSRETEVEKELPLEEEHIWPVLSTTKQVLLGLAMTLAMMLNVCTTSLYTAEEG